MVCFSAEVDNDFYSGAEWGYFEVTADHKVSREEFCT
jgi:hypothetical protein